MLKVTKKADYKIYTQHIMKSIVLLRFKLKTKLKKTIQYIKVLIREITSCVYIFKTFTIKRKKNGFLYDFNGHNKVISV